MMNARVQYTVGYGVMVANLKGANWNALQNEISKFNAWKNVSKAIIEKVVYTYPSGKVFTSKGSF